MKEWVMIILPYIVLALVFVLDYLKTREERKKLYRLTDEIFDRYMSIFTPERYESWALGQRIKKPEQTTVNFAEQAEADRKNKSEKVIPQLNR